MFLWLLVEPWQWKFKSGRNRSENFWTYYNWKIATQLIRAIELIFMNPPKTPGVLLSRLGLLLLPTKVKIDRIPGFSLDNYRERFYL